MSATTSAISKERMITFGLFIGYGYYSLLRKSFSVAVPFMRVTLGLSKADVGNIATSFSIAYGISKFVGGVVSDFLPPNALFAMGLFLAALSNLLFSFSTSMTALFVLWFLNGTVQGFGWPALSHIVTNNVDPSRAGTTWSILVSGGNLGYLLGPFFLLPLTKYGWEMPFRVCGAVGMIFACLVYGTLSYGIDSVNKIDKNSIEIKLDENVKMNGEKSSEKNASKSTVESAEKKKSAVKKELAGDSLNEIETTESKSKILWNCAFSLNLWLLILVGGLTTFVLKSMADWTGLYLVEHCSVSVEVSTELMLWNEMGGMVGTLLCGVLSDLLGGRKYLTLFIFVSLCIPAMIYFPGKFPAMDNMNILSESMEQTVIFSDQIPEILSNSFQQNFTTLSSSSAIFRIFSGHVGLARVCLFFMGFGINGPKTLLGVMVRDLVPRGVSGTVGGIYGLVAQVGASVSGAGLGYVLEAYGWESFMNFLLYGIISIAVFLVVPVITLNSSHNSTSKEKKD